jgi:hypothetical protein
MLPSTSALYGVDGWCHAPATLHPRMARYPLHKGPGGLYGRSGRVREILPASGFYPQTVWSAANRNTDYAVSVTLRLRWVAIYYKLKFLKKGPLIVIHRASKSWHGEYWITIFDALHGKMLLIFGSNFWLSPLRKKKGVYSSEIFEKLYQNTGNDTLYDNIIQGQPYDELVFNTFWGYVSILLSVR